jgi:NACHT domain
MVRQHRALLVMSVTVALLGLLAGLVVNSASAQTRWPGWLELARLHPWPSLAILMIVMAILAVLGVALNGEDPPSVDLPAVADRLAIAVKSQWDAEAEWRRLNDPYPMQVRWGPADTDLVAGWSALTRLATTGAGWPVAVPGRWAEGPDALAGADNDLVDVLGRIPTGRLVVLGEPGAGKTILLMRLVLGLLAHRLPGKAVPVLLPLASWNPVKESLHDWMERWLITDNVVLADPAPNRPNASRARALLDAGLILPVLDSLDEIPNAVRGPAIARINDAMRPGGRLVVASRTQEYRAAVRPPDGVEICLTGAAGICLSSLDANVVASYLKDSAGGPAGVARWDPIIATFTADDRSPAAKALTTPLMAALARANYNPRPGESAAAVPDQPVELLDRERFPNHESIRFHLFDRFIQAAYREHPDPSRRSKWSAVQAQRWLVYLAHDLEHRQRGTTDIAWWKLHGAAPRLLPAMVLGLVAGLAGTFGWFSGNIGLGVGLATACLVGLLVRRLVQFGEEGHARGLVGGLLGGQLGALVSLAAFGSGPGGGDFMLFFGGGLAFGLAAVPLGKGSAAFAGAFAGVIIAILSIHTTISQVVGGIHVLATPIVNGIGFGIAAAVAVSLSRRRLPARGMRWSPLGLVCGLIIGLVIGTLTWIQAGPTCGLLVGLVGMITGGYAGGFAFEIAATDLTKPTTPTEVLVRDRNAFRSGTLGLGIATGLSTGLAFGLIPIEAGGSPGWRIGLSIGLANFIGVGLTVGFLQASWGSYSLTRWWLAVSSRLPWRLMTFLADAHKNRGVLRQAGAVYQFRHVDLQRRLARWARCDECRRSAVDQSAKLGIEAFDRGVSA